MARFVWIFLHQGAGRGAVFVFFAALPWVLPLEAVGRFSLVYAAFLLVLQPAFDTAAGALVTRAAARGDGRTERRVAALACGALAAVAALIAVPALGLGLWPLGGWLALSLAVSQPLGLLFAAARGRGRFDVEGIAGTLQKFAQPVALALLAPAAPGPPADETLPARALLLAGATGWLVALALLARRPWGPAASAPAGGPGGDVTGEAPGAAAGDGGGAAGGRPAPGRDTASGGGGGAGAGAGSGTGREMAWLTLLAAVGVLTLRLDLALLGALRSLEEAGRWATALRWVEAAYVLPFGLMLALFPSWASRPLDRRSVRGSTRLFGLAGIAAAAAVAGAALLLVPRLYPADVAPGIARLVLLLAPAALAVAFGTWFGQALVARDRTPRALGGALAGLAAKVAVGALAIPAWGAEGAVLATVVAEGVAAAVACAWLHRTLAEESGAETGTTMASRGVAATGPGTGTAAGRRAAPP